MEKIAIIGAGLIGRAWAMVFARAGHPVKLWDADVAAVPNALALMEEALKEAKGFGLFMLKAVLDGRVSQLIDLAKVNLVR